MPEALNWRASLILESGLAGLVGFTLWLLLGHYIGKFDLWKIVVDARIKEVVLRLIFEIAAFIVATTVVLVITVKDDGESAVWAFVSYISVYSARSIIGALAGAKSAVMTQHLPDHCPPKWGPGGDPNGGR
jgi:hypothetical protein